MTKTYTVTVTPKAASYAGSCTMGEYTVTVRADNSADAIKQARRARRNEEGRYAVAATYRARVDEEVTE
jgi:hypothetical protein